MGALPVVGMNMLAQEARRARGFLLYWWHNQNSNFQKVFIFDQGIKAHAFRGHAEGVLVRGCAYKTPEEQA